MIHGKDIIRTFIATILVSFLTASCREIRYENYPGQQFSFSCAEYNCILSTPNGAWFKPQTEDFNPAMMRMIYENGEVFRLSRTPDMEERLIIHKLARENKLTYAYLNYISVKRTNLQSAPTKAQALKLIRLPSARASEMKAYKKTLKYFQKIYANDTIFLGNPAWEVYVSGNHKDLLGILIRIKTLYFIKGKNLFRIKGVCPESGVESFFKEYAQIVASMTIQ